MATSDAPGTVSRNAVMPRTRSRPSKIDWTDSGLGTPSKNSNSPNGVDSRSGVETCATSSASCSFVRPARWCLRSSCSSPCWLLPSRFVPGALGEASPEKDDLRGDCHEWRARRRIVTASAILTSGSVHLSVGGGMVEHLFSEYLVDRPALKRRMDAALSLPLTLVVAQAGAGKTVLLNQWAAEHPEVEYLWVDVETADNDPVRFARRLLSELATVRPEMEQLGHLTVLNAGGLGTPLLDALTTELGAFPECVIVLDDLHHLSNGTLLADLGRLVADAPPNVHVVISSRVDPSIPWSRLRLRNRLLEVRQADLAMTEHETEELLARITRRDVPPAIRDVLLSRTEGWAAGLQLAGLTLRFQEHPDEFVAEFSGTDRLIAEYLTEEVLDAVPEASRSLLLRMSLFDTMTADLVDAVLERSDAHAALRAVRARIHVPRRHSTPIESISGSITSSAISSAIGCEPRTPRRRSRLLDRAAEYHLARGELVPAVEYLLRAREWDRALDAIMTSGSHVFERGEMSTVIRWITTVPEASRAHRLDVALELGILVGMQGEAARAFDAFSRVASDPRATIGHRMIAEAWSSATAQWNPRPDDTIRASERALRLIEANPELAVPDLMRLTTPALLNTLATGSGGRSHFLAGDLAEADAWMSRSLSTEGVAYPPFRAGVLGSLALLRIWSGRATEAELFSAEAREIAARTGLLAHPVMADALLADALVAYERGQPHAAAGPLQRRNHPRPGEPPHADGVDLAVRACRARLGRRSLRGSARTHRPVEARRDVGTGPGDPRPIGRGAHGRAASHGTLGGIAPCFMPARFRRPLPSRSRRSPRRSPSATGNRRGGCSRLRRTCSKPRGRAEASVG